MFNATLMTKQLIIIQMNKLNFGKFLKGVPTKYIIQNKFYV